MKEAVAWSKRGRGGWRKKEEEHTESQQKANSEVQLKYKFISIDWANKFLTVQSTSSPPPFSYASANIASNMARKRMFGQQQQQQEEEEDEEQEKEVEQEAAAASSQQVYQVQ